MSYCELKVSIVITVNSSIPITRSISIASLKVSPLFFSFQEAVGYLGCAKSLNDMLPVFQASNVLRLAGYFFGHSLLPKSLFNQSHCFRSTFTELKIFSAKKNHYYSNSEVSIEFDIFGDLEYKKKNKKK